MQLLTRLGLLTTTGTPTGRAAFWLPLAGAGLTSTGVALWLFS
jgi:hypothetical protein